jgi:heterotetrameric sarcosine oxidase gamma subunit
MADLATNLARASALAEGEWRGRGLSCAEVPHSTKLLLRGRARDEALANFERILGFALPRSVGPVNGEDPASILLAPDRWILLASAASAPALNFQLTAALDGSGLRVSDVSDGLVEIAIEGLCAVDLLASATPLDLRLSQFAAGNLAQTQFARTSCLVRRLGPTRFSLFVDRSYASYAWSWLVRHAPLVSALG